MQGSRRRIVNLHQCSWRDYDLEGPLQPELGWLPVSFERATGQGSYLMRMQPGAVTLPHTHPGMEEYLVVEGDLVEDDGTVLGPGDFVSYRPGTRHHSRTVGGCLLVVFEWRPAATES